MEKKLISILLCTITAISLIGCGSSKSKETTNPKTDTASVANSNSTEKKETKEDAISFSNILIKSKSGSTIVNGEAKSNDGKKHTCTIKVSFYDKDKKLLGTAAGSVNELQPTETKIFTAMASGDYSKSDSYKVEVDTMVQSSKPDDESKIKFSNLVSKVNSGTTKIDGEVKNDDAKEHSFTIIIGFYDKDNKLIGTGMGSMNNLSAGSTKTYTAMAAGDFSGAAKTTVQVDTLIQ